MAQQPGTNRQVPDHSIMDLNGKQCYLGNQFIYALANQEITTTSETPLFLLSNPAVSANAFPAGYTSLFLNLSKLVCLTASQTAVLRFYLNPTGISGGTSKIPLNLRTGSGTASVASLVLSPTGSASGSLIDVLSSLPGQPDESQMLAIVDPGNSLLVTAQTSSATTYIATKLGWYEL